MRYKLHIRIAFLLITVFAAGMASADCLSMQRHVQMLEQRGRNQSIEGMNPGNILNMDMCSNMGLVRWLRAKCAFIRECWAELGMSELQGDDAANKAETDAEMLASQMRGCR